MKIMSFIRIKLGTGISTRFVQKFPKFCRIFVVTIFLEEIVPYGLPPRVFRKWCLFLDNMRNFLNMPVKSVFSFFIRNPLMDRPVIWIWWHKLFYLKMADSRWRYFCKIVNLFQVFKINFRSVVFLCTY